MTLGEKIREIRILRNMTQKELGEAVGLSATRIGHYEMNYRKPKSNTLKSIADALNVGISVFLEIKIDTICDLKAILFQIDRKCGIKFEGKTDKNGKYINGTVTISFDNEQINSFLTEWANMQKVLSDMIQESKKHDTQTQNSVNNYTAEMKKKFESNCYTNIGNSIMFDEDINNIKVKLSSSNPANNYKE